MKVLAIAACILTVFIAVKVQCDCKGNGNTVITGDWSSGTYTRTITANTPTSSTGSSSCASTGKPTLVASCSSNATCDNGSCMSTCTCGGTNCIFNCSKLNVCTPKAGNVCTNIVGSKTICTKNNQAMGKHLEKN